MTAFEITEAYPSDVEELSSIAMSAKALWNYPPKWLELWRDELSVTASYVRANPVRVARVEGDPIGFCGLTVTGSTAEIDHLWVRPEWTRKGVGAALMDRCLADLSTMSVREVRVVSDPNAAGFYRSQGFASAGTFRYDLAGSARELPVLIRRL